MLDADTDSERALIAPMVTLLRSAGGRIDSHGVGPSINARLKPHRSAPDADLKASVGQRVPGRAPRCGARGECHPRISKLLPTLSMHLRRRAVIASPAEAQVGNRLPGDRRKRCRYRRTSGKSAPSRAGSATRGKRRTLSARSPIARTFNNTARRMPISAGHSDCERNTQCRHVPTSSQPRFR